MTALAQPDWQDFESEVHWRWPALGTADLDALWQDREDLCSCLCRRYGLAPPDARDEIESWLIEIGEPEGRADRDHLRRTIRIAEKVAWPQP